MEPLEEVPNPGIGSNRKFYNNISVDPFIDTIEIPFTPPNKNSPEFEQTQKDNAIIYESLLLKNQANLKQYKETGGKLLYHDDELFPKNTSIDYNSLMTILSYDESANESFVSKDKGIWYTKKEDETKNNISNIDKDLEKLNINNNNNTNGNKETYNENYDINIIEFESRFESGNLRMAIQVNDNEYDLILKNDINAFKYSQWYFFQAKINLPKDNSKSTFKFNIINCEKEDSIYNRGLKVLCYSKNNNSWSRVGRNIYYYANGLSIETKKYYTITFTIDMEQSDTLYLCYCYPYPFSYLQKFLNRIEKKSNNNIFRREVLGKTLAGNNIDLLLITNFSSNFDDIAVRPAVVFTARVHPSETCASFVIHGIIDFLVSDRQEAVKLRNDYVFKIIPMLNPDGVINGSTRCSLLGKDLNRLWPDPRDNVCPTIFYAKEMIRKTLLSRNIFLYCDFHGHSNSNNFFLYGCETEGREGKSYQEKVLSRLIASKFDAYDHGPSTYKIVKTKRTTARSIVKNEFGITYSYCLEASLCGVTIGKDKGKFFTPKLLLNISNAFCLSLIDLTNKTIYNKIIGELIEDETNRILAKQNNMSDKSIPLYKNKSDYSSSNKLVKISREDGFRNGFEDKKPIKKTISETNIYKLESNFKSDNSNSIGNSSEFSNSSKSSKKSITTKTNVAVKKLKK